MGIPAGGGAPPTRGDRAGHLDAACRPDIARPYPFRSRTTTGIRRDVFRW